MSNNTTSYPQSLPHGYELQGEKNKYIIDHTLGQGAFGITYLAKCRTEFIGQMGSGSAWLQVCIKEFFMKDLNSRDDDTGSLRDTSDNSLISRYRRAFLREANNLARMQHPNIVNVFEVIEANNTAYIVMEYIDGGNLDDYITRKGHLTEDEALRLFRPLCDAMSYMHAQHMLHLDLKPKNVMLDESGNPYLIDFGLSKQYTEDGEPESSTTIGLGTPGYAPSEQAEQRDGDNTFRATIDVYALGGTLYKMLTGNTPPKASEVLNDDELLSTNLKKAGVNDNLISVVEKAMKPASSKRYQSVAELMSVLNQSPRTVLIEDTIQETSENEETVITAKHNVEKEKEAQKAIPLPPESTFPKWLLPAIAGVAAGVATLVITILSLRSYGKEDPTIQLQPTTHNGHEYVDLGLSVMWATTNMGASTPYEYGDHYAWGDIFRDRFQIDCYSWETLEYCTSGDSYDNVKFSKYNTNSDRGTVDNKKVLEDIDDAASFFWGGSWRMPTKAEWQELKDSCTWRRSIVGGYEVTSKSNGNSIYLPDAGYRWNRFLSDTDKVGCYWSSSLDADDPISAWGVRFDSDTVRVTSFFRCGGYSVRPVCYL